MSRPEAGRGRDRRTGSLWRDLGQKRLDRVKHRASSSAIEGAILEDGRNRFVSVTFDDGLLRGARTAVELLEKYRSKGTFYLVTGWVRPNRVKIRDQWNQGRDHGSWAEWREIEARGHDIGSHTVSHINVRTNIKARLARSVLIRELADSYDDLRNHLQKPPVSIAMPYDAMTFASKRLVKRVYQAARVGRRRVAVNDLHRIDWYRLQSWALDPTMPMEKICQRIAGIPPNHWLILQFHSLGDEGWMPISPITFDGILKFISECDNLRQVTVREMVEEFKNTESENQSAISLR